MVWPSLVRQRPLLPPAATNSVNLSLSALVRVLSGSNVSNLTLVIGGAASSVTNVAVTAEKI